ncbi:hypothetical protein N7530_002968 [Penicillium desertorum]|uniref:Uncharacterized protein n=1 Tax=Penicillium desertorum TaxID=1303715 RepID=A0A9W9X4I0_9EURO|nr:hypothetical protein N7530_002968 [Penicillium desertorum]
MWKQPGLAVLEVSGNLRSIGTQAEDGRGFKVPARQCRQRQPLGQMPVHPFIHAWQNHFPNEVT